jgi:hypothetical protein
MQAYMFKDLPQAEAQARAKEVAGWFNSHTIHRSHGKPLRYDDLRERNVRVKLLEADGALQDKVLSAWHGVQLSLSQVAVSKLVENNEGNAWILSGSPGLPILLGRFKGSVQQGHRSSGGGRGPSPGSVVACG